MLLPLLINIEDLVKAIIMLAAIEKKWPLFQQV